MYMMKNFVNDAFEWCGSVDCTSLSNASLGAMQKHDDFSFLWSSAPIGGVNKYSLINAAHHNIDVVDFEDKYAVKNVDEFGGIPTASTEKRYRLVLVGEQGLDLR